MESQAETVVVTITLAPSSIASDAVPLPVETVINAVDLKSRTFVATLTVTAPQGDETAVLTTVITAVNSGPHTVLTTLTLAPTLTPNIGDLVCSGIGGCATATRSAPLGEFTGGAKRERDVSRLVNPVVVGLFGVVIALV